MRSPPPTVEAAQGSLGRLAVHARVAAVPGSFLNRSMTTDPTTLVRTPVRQVRQATPTHVHFKPGHDGDDRRGRRICRPALGGQASRGRRLRRVRRVLAAYGLVTGAQNGQLQETTRAVRTAASEGLPGHARCWSTRASGSAWPFWSSRRHRCGAHGCSPWIAACRCCCSPSAWRAAVYAHLCGALSGRLDWVVVRGAAVGRRADPARWCGDRGRGRLGRHRVPGRHRRRVGVVVPAARGVGLGPPCDRRRRRRRALTSDGNTAMAAASAVLVMGFPLFSST